MTTAPIVEVAVANDGESLIKQHTSARAFLKWVGPLLYADEAVNSLMLGLCESLARAPETPEPAPLFLRILDKTQTRAAALQTPPHNLILMRTPDDELAELASFLATRAGAIPGVVGPSHEVEAFARAWGKKTGARVRQTIDQCLYRLDTVTFPPKMPQGCLRQAGSRDARLLAQWLAEFMAEAMPFEQKTPKQYRAQVKAKIDQGQAYVWSVGKTPVAVAFSTRPTRNGISIGPVYTPMHERGKGHASALTAELSQRMLDEGRKFCVLYTDLSNPTSNKIYAAIGYRPIADSRYVVFN